MSVAEDIKSLIYTTIFTFILVVVFVAALSGVESFTRSSVELNARVAEYKAVLNALGEENLAERTNEDIIAGFDGYFPDVQGGQLSYPLKARVNGEEVLVDRFSGKGLWGRIAGVIAVNAGVDTIVGLDIIEQAETPGLGGRITEDWFKDQFRGEKITSGKFRVTAAVSAGGDSDHSNGRVDAIAGATLTSGYMQVIVNDALDSIRTMEGV